MLNDPAARTLVARGLEAVFLPGRGMLGASLRHHGAELLRRVDDLAGAAAQGSTAGLPILHPWANRLDGNTYRAAGQSVTLDPSSPLVHLDERGLPIHGVPWSQLVWEVVDAGGSHLLARLHWTRPELLVVFPFPHRIDVAATLRPDGLTLETTLRAGDSHPVPVSFGFHPYLGLPGCPRAEWRLRLPPMRKLALDERGIPSGAEEAFAGLDAGLGGRSFDDGFALRDPRSVFSLEGAGRRITVGLLAGYTHAQIFAPRDKDLVALEPMTAPTDALSSGRGLRLVEPAGEFRAAFRIGIAEL